MNILGGNVINTDQEETITGRPPIHPYIVGIIGFIFGPMAGGIVTYINFKTFGQKSKAIVTLLITVIGTFALLFFLYKLPENAPSTVSGIGNVVSFLFFPTIQWFDYEKWRRNNPGVATYTGWKAAGWGIMGFIVKFIMSLIIIIILS